MAQPVNPYVAGVHLQGEEGFFGRRDTLDWVAHGLRNPSNNSLVLFGQRRIGKTSLLLQLQRTLPADAFLPVYFDLQDQTRRSLDQVLADLADAVAEQLNVEPPDPQLFDSRGLFFRRTFLSQVHSLLGKHRRLVFLLDEFDVLDEAEEVDLPETAATKSFLRFARRVMTKDPRPAFVFVVGRLVDDLDLDYTAIFKASLVREVWVLDPESAEALVRQAEAAGRRTLRFTDQAVARILQLTSGHPYLTQLLCRRVWERAYFGNPTTIPLIDVPQVEEAVPDALEAGHQALTWVWNGLSLAEKIYAAGVAGATDEGDTISEERGIQVLAAHAARLVTRNVELAPRDLVRRRVLDMPGEREYRFAVELFRLWVCQHKPLQQVKEELDQVEPLAAELFSIGQGFFRRCQWETASRYFRDALQANPYHFHARLYLGEALLEMNQVDEAVAELGRAYELDREEAHLSLARALVAQARVRDEAGDENGALAACERALRLSPNVRTAREIRNAILVRRLKAEAHSYEREERWAEAVKAYEQLVAQAPDEESQREWETALERCRQEKFLARLYMEGMAALERRKWQRAQKAFSEVVHMRPDYGGDGQLAAQLLLRAVLHKPVRGRMRFLAIGIVALLAIVVVGWYFSPWRGMENQSVLPPVELPAHWEHVHTYRLDANRDGDPEWVVLYRFDLVDEAGQDGDPMGGIVYQVDSKSSAVITPYELRPQGGDYLCECECVAKMEDVLSGSPGSELVIRDYCDGEITRSSIFYWDAGAEEYVPKGHFSGSRVEVTLDQVKVDRRVPHRAQLALRQSYRPKDAETYYEPFSRGILVMPEEYELVFYQAEPRDVTRSPYPEKVVFAFYNHYTSAERAAGYFTQEGWERLRHCAAGQCGCSSARSEVAYVRVTDLQPVDERQVEDEYRGPDRAVFDFDVICELRNGESEKETAVRWYLVRQDGRWKLNDADAD